MLLGRKLSWEWPHKALTSRPRVSLRRISPRYKTQVSSEKLSLSLSGCRLRDLLGYLGFLSLSPLVSSPFMQFHHFDGGGGFRRGSIQIRSGFSLFLSAWEWDGAPLCECCYMFLPPTCLQASECARTTFHSLGRRVVGPTKEKGE